MLSIKIEIILNYIFDRGIFFLPIVILVILNVRYNWAEKNDFHIHEVIIDI